MLKLRIAVSVCLLTLLVFLLLDQTNQEESALVSAQNSLLQQASDYYITNMVSTHFDAKGQPNYQLAASRVTHFLAGDISQMETPRFTYYRATGLPWIVTADTGNLQNDVLRSEDLLQLAQKVSLHKGLTDNKFMQVDTTNMLVFPASREVSTNQPVTLTTEDSYLESAGMRAMLDTDKIELLTQVRGYHD